MSYGQNGLKNEKFERLARKVETLSKIVDGLQAEVDDLKAKASKEKKIPISEEPKTLDVDTSKLSRFQRLNIFRKDNKTKEKTMNSKADTLENLKASTEDTSSGVNLKNASTSRRQQTTTQPSGREDSEDKSHRKSRSTQSVSFPKEVEFSCVVKTCAAQTENNSDDSESLQKYIESASDSNAKSISEGCHKMTKTKMKKNKNKSTKSKTSRCAKNCPYMVHDNRSDKKKQEKDKSKKKDASVEACCKAESYVNKNDQHKNKKTMVSFTSKSDKIKVQKNISDNCNFSLNCKRFETSSRPNEMEINRALTSTLHSLDHDGKCLQVKETYCKRCFKKCKTKNVLKINKAILTHEPPVIVMPPRNC